MLILSKDQNVGVCAALGSHYEINAVPGVILQSLPFL
jgi:hypothetical protein